MAALPACTGERAQRANDSGQAAEIPAADPTPLASSPSFRLVGNEPFWSLTIDASGMTFRTPEDTVGERFGAATPVMAGDSLRWNSVGDAVPVEAVVIHERCPDSMADKTWPYRAGVRIGTARYEGCAQPLPD